MSLTRIEAHNFKSFRDLDVSLGSLNVLIGANASGKSNFVQLLRFVRDIVNFGLSNAVSVQGGSEYIANLALGRMKPISVEFQTGHEAFYGGFASFITTAPSDHSIRSEIAGIEYRFSLDVSPNGNPKIIGDDLVIERKLFKQSDDEREPFYIGDSPLLFSVSKGKLTYKSLPPTGLTRDQTDPLSLKTVINLANGDRIRIDNLILESLQTNSGILPNIRADIFARMAIYDFNTKLPKQTAQITGKIDLEEDGSNLVIALKNILEDEGQRREFSNLLHDVLPFAEGVDVQRLADRFLHFRLRERYSGDQYLPASLLSDGTIHVIALIVALYFSDKPLIVIEEPERNIHPSLLARVAALLKDASQHKQIIVTTHNPEIVKHVELEDLLFVSRDREGFSTIRRPAESADVRVFLENEIGIDELFARNLLGA